VLMLRGVRRGPTPGPPAPTGGLNTSTASYRLGCSSEVTRMQAAPMTRDNYCPPHERDESAGALPVYEAGVYLHGTMAELLVGEMLVPGRESNFEEGRVMNYVYFTATLDPAVWGAELASG
jgi:hypothetical protein